ncbi:LCP family protein [Rhodococcus sp. HNM0569]|uniref:LCP family protein n=1 Tax=Rhodococcus sp. HNM0569 TaxID=2716340 RepID=UPI00197FE0FC|nr:LCP family protein [Rhodococcus sp. HNM0569]
MSVLALVFTGLAWRSIDSIRNNLATASGLGLGGSEDGAIDILMVGTDSRTDAHGNPLSQHELDSLRAGEEEANNTDTIILIRVPTDGSSATAISIPRDSYVDVPGIGKSKINAAYGATKAEEKQQLLDSGESERAAEDESTKAGREALVKSVAGLTGITVDHYAEVGLLGFVLLTDAVGGVDVCLNSAVDEPLSGAHFQEGEQTLQGSDALSFVRQRHDLPRGDLDRIVRQQVFMASLVNKVLSARTLSDPAKLGQLSGAVERSVVLDENWDIVDFATQLQNLSGGEVQFRTIPVQDLAATTDYGESIVKVDSKEVEKFVATLVGDGADSESSTTDDSESSTTTDGPDVDESSITVDVENAGDIGGLATDVSQALVDLGYRKGEVGNYAGASAVSETTVYGHSADDDEAAAVAAALGDVATDSDPTLRSGTVRVVLASDYDGPGTATSTGSTGSSSSETSTSSGSSSSGSSTGGSDGTSGTATPVPAGPPITAATGARCVN